MADYNYKQPDRPRYGQTGPQRQGGGYSSGGNNNSNETAESKFGQLNYEPRWITEGATPELVAYAEEAGKFMAAKKLTSSKFRSIYGEIKRIQMGEFEKEKPSFYLLKPKMAYALGRDAGNEGLKLFKLVFDRASNEVSDKKSYLNFCNFIEAILAYHKAYGGKD
ncbi:type III-A CRISPR-associated protein Csm2 [Bacteroides zoogleoformans]|uniref:type III-A CRISPR-associated protein Csm2 n=1 Tax=Bacteroides zoogleoformans TaxID=28119 RepID=UPI00248E1D2A|nr:type III-A CRISPR-associated protein Csm2 [Bacteroides zoogleoformans]